MFIFGARNFQPRHEWYEKPAPKTGARQKMESFYMAPVSGACVMGTNVMGTRCRPPWRYTW